MAVDADVRCQCGYIAHLTALDQCTACPWCGKRIWRNDGEGVKCLRCFKTPSRCTCPEGVKRPAKRKLRIE
jgi:hypothetical protein